ncbi:hypothetical protein A3C87_02530 [Candidatus Kaiserbacteria bacterium RIFCSPHIGHO2_02_FULL_49_34]|uniref:Uncharacterized protein n=1 Tax=Candidatus Kaiserbacteria bacterium RIFCSPHIGHO2_02_FULL_49_34 TaxID=1798491 RepID=A0A1F6DIL5_9BACT|nr:MAG: hypothetical protein A3C87_02530 [Candidatus Kaiserbacteria bacterium RIFCSPHIGHO2_02_FULL_49_34]
MRVRVTIGTITHEPHLFAFGDIVMKSLLAPLFLVACLLQSDAFAHRKKSHVPTVSREAIILGLITDCIAKRKAPTARADIFTYFIQSPHIRGTPEKISKEICLASYDNLGHFNSQKDIRSAVIKETLVPVMHVSIAWPNELPGERRVLLPWAATYLENLVARAHAKGVTLRATSLVRSTSHQTALARSGASPAHCKRGSLLCSTHTTGAAFDISTRTLRADEITWLTKELLADMKAHRIIFIREYRGAHFHIFVPRPTPK